MSRRILLRTLVTVAVVLAFGLPVVAQGHRPALQNPWQSLVSVLVPLGLMWATNLLNWLESTQRITEIGVESKQVTTVILGVLASWAGYQGIPTDIYGPILNHIGPSLSGAIAAGLSTLAYDAWSLLIAWRRWLQAQTPAQARRRP